MDQDKTLTCADCGAEFIFTAKEQAYYAERGFMAPKRCKPCREAKKSAGGGGGPRGMRSGGGGGGDDMGGGARPTFDATCASCGQPTQVPFRPAPGRPVYCRNCYRQKSPRAGGGGGGGSYRRY